MTTPATFFDVAELALSCVCAQMDAVAAEVASYPGCPCWSYVSAGEAAFDHCCTDCEGNSGELTVYISDVFPSDNFPTASVADPCKAATWVALLVVTASRCAPSPDEQGNPPSPEEQSATAEIVATDLYAILQGLTCCLRSEPVGHKTKRRVQIAAAGNTTITASGGCVGVEVRAYVEIGSVCGCGEGS